MLATVCAFVVIGAFVYAVRQTLVVILFAILFAYLLEPLVLRIQNSKLALGSRSFAILETYIAIGIFLVALGMLFGPQLTYDARQLGQSLPSLLENVTSGKIVWQFGNRHGWSFDTQLRIEQFIRDHQAEILNWTGQIGTDVARSLQNVIWIVLVPILAIFFLRDGRRFATEFLGIFQQERQRRVLRDIANDVDEILAHFIRAQIILAGIALVVYCAVFSAIRLPYALVLGLVAGALEFIPVVGALVAAVIILAVGFLTGYSHLWLLVLFFGVWRVIQDYAIAPRVLGGQLELHPLAAIVAVLMGGELGGVLGVYLSIPAVATLRVLWRRWQKYVAVVAAAEKFPDEPLRPRPTPIIKR